VVPDERGRLMELVRADDPLFTRFGQVYITVAYPGVVKAWHRHARQTDLLAVVSGMAQIALYDGRDGSPTHGEIAEIHAGVHQPVLVRVPPGVWHGFKCTSPEECVVVNMPSETYDRDNPDEERADPHAGAIPYDWTRRDR
jgi:dTDP-4-dehydrorhamnose 3,5-epimerase